MVGVRSKESIVNVYLTEEQQEAWEAYKLGWSHEDWHLWRREHANIFLHVPTPDFEAREPCTHPMHLAFARAMNGGDMQMRHELIRPSTIETADDPEIDPRYGTKEYRDRLADGWDGVITGREE
jgi:hypothetical protein